MSIPTRLLLAGALAGPVLAAPQDLYSTDFSSLGGWTADVVLGTPPSFTWAADATPQVRCGGQAPFRSAPASLNFNDGVDIGSGGFLTGGRVVSPVIDLSAANSPLVLEFWASFDMETGCSFDAVHVSVAPVATNLSVDHRCLDEGNLHDPQCTWRRYWMPLDPAWGEVRIRFSFQSGDTSANTGSGPFIDDLRIYEGCEASALVVCDGYGNSASPAGAALHATGSFSVLADDLGLTGADFPAHSFALLFCSPGRVHGDPPAGLASGRLCVGGPGTIRAGLAPTRDQGAPLWTLPLSALASTGGPIVAGTTLYFQAAYRDGAFVRYSDTIQVGVCD